MGAAGGGLLGDRVEGVGEGMGGSGNLAGGRGGTKLCLLLPFSSCEGRRGVRERTGRYDKMSE